MDRDALKRLIREIHELQDLLEDYATYREEEENEAMARYSELYVDVDLKLNKLGYEHINPHRSLRSIWSFSKTQGLETYMERRKYIRELYEDIVFDIQRTAAGEKEARNWKKADEAIGDGLAPVRAQWLKAKNFIYGAPPDFENSIKESINSVESTLKILLDRPKGTLGQLVTKAEIDPDIARLISGAYGMVSNKDFVRHGGTKRQDLGTEEAEFFLELAAIAIIYLKAKHSAKQATVDDRKCA